MQSSACAACREEDSVEIRQGKDHHVVAGSYGGSTVIAPVVRFTSASIPLLGDLFGWA